MPRRPSPNAPFAIKIGVREDVASRRVSLNNDSNRPRPAKLRPYEISRFRHSFGLLAPFFVEQDARRPPLNK
jgi:hypothetical protein